jgi:hypothetical protein
MTCKLITRKAEQQVQLKRIAPKPRQLVSMKLHQHCPTVTKGHKLIGVTPVAKLTNAHRHPTCSQTNKAHRHPTYSQTKNNAYRLRTYCIP